MKAFAGQNISELFKPVVKFTGVIDKNAKVIDHLKGVGTMSKEISSNSVAGDFDKSETVADVTARLGNQ